MIVRGLTGAEVPDTEGLALGAGAVPVATGGVLLGAGLKRHGMFSTSLSR